MRKYPFLRHLVEPFETTRRAHSAALVIAAIVSCGQARSMAIATVLGQWLGTRLDSALNRFYRLLHNKHFDDLLFVKRWADVLTRAADRHLLIAIDWTEWHHQLRMLAACAVTGRRAIPLFVRAYTKVVGIRSQNSRENTFLRVLAAAIKSAGVRATILCDRGFRRVSWLKLLDELDFRFVVRLMDDLTVEYNGESMALADILLPRGQAVDLGVVAVRADRAIQVRIVGYWGWDAKEPWWIATNCDDKPQRILSLYDRRMTIEECCRDTKGRRFGVKLFWTQFQDPEALARFTMLLAVALLIWMIHGTSAVLRNPSLLLPHRTKGPRQSLVTIGLRVPPDPPSVPLLTLRVLAKMLQLPDFRQLGRPAIGGK